MNTLTTTPVHAGATNYDALLDLAMPDSVREPDLYDDGRAVWLHPTGVVHLDMDRLVDVPDLLTQPRIVVSENPMRWVRLHPSHYGVEVDSFHEHHGEVASHAAQVAWTIFEQAVTR